MPFAHYCTAAWKPFASCFIAVPCDWLAVSVVQRSASVPHFAARLACLRVLATTAYAYLLLLLLLLLPPLLLPLRYLFCLCLTLPAYPLTSTNPPIHPASQPYPGQSRRLPASHPSHSTQTLSQLQDPHSLALPSLVRLLPVALSRPLLFFRVAHGGEPLHALLVTTHVQPAGPAGPEEIARLGRRTRPTMRRANRVPVA